MTNEIITQQWLNTHFLDDLANELGANEEEFNWMTYMSFLFIIGCETSSDGEVVWNKGQSTNYKKIEQDIFFAHEQKQRLLKKRIHAGMHPDDAKSFMKTLTVWTEKYAQCYTKGTKK